jgi:hypothetical protein
MKSMRQRLARLERHFSPVPHPAVVCTDDQGYILDHQSEAACPCVGCR